jgi:hypothetical protein
VRILSAEDKRNEIKKKPAGSHYKTGFLKGIIEITVFYSIDKSKR